MVAFANGHIKIPSFKRGPLTVNPDYAKEAHDLSMRPEELSAEVRKRFSPEFYLPELFDRPRETGFALSNIKPIASGRRLAFKVEVHFSGDETSHSAILVEKNLQNEKRYAHYLALVGLNSYGIVCGPNSPRGNRGAIEAIPGQSFGAFDSQRLEGLSKEVAFELGANFYAGYLLGKQDRTRSNYFFSETPSKLGQMVTSIDHEDLFQLDPKVYRKTAQNEEVDMLSSLPLYKIDRSAVLERFEAGVRQQHEISLDSRGDIRAIITEAEPSFLKEFERRMDQNPLDVLDEIYAFRARMERNIFAQMKRTLLGRW